MEKAEPNALHTMISAACAGSLVTLMFFPLECAEAKMQMGTHKTSLFKTMQTIKQEQGIRGLYRGALPSMMGSAVNSGLYFTLYEFFKNELHQRYGNTLVAEASSVEMMIAGMLSGVICCLIVNPFWVLKFRILSHPSTTYSQIWNDIQVNGYGILWKGIIPSLIGVPEGAIQFAAYDQFLFYLRPQVPNSVAHFTAGALGKILATITMYPYQVVRARLMKSSSNPSIPHIVKSIYAQEGVAAFYAGVKPNLIRTLLPTGLTFYIVDAIKQVLRKL